ncbi:MAG: polysaccharide biosynthesis/export family protein [bacterium]
MNRLDLRFVFAARRSRASCPGRPWRVARTRGAVLAPVLTAALLALAPAAHGQGSDSAGVLSDAWELRAGDMVRLQVQDEPELSGETPVNEDGWALFPLVGRVEVAGRPFGEVRRELQSLYGRELVEPVVVATPVIQVAVLGEVRAPGVVPVDPTRTLGDVLASVGGLTPTADEGEISLVREGEVVSGRLEPGAGLLEARLRSGDRIVVGEEGWFDRHMPVLVGAAASVAAAAVTGLIVRR